MGSPDSSLTPCAQLGSSQTQEKGRHNAAPLCEIQIELQNLNVLRLPTLGTLGHVELHSLTFLQRTEAIGLNRGVMHEDVFSVCAAQKSKSLCVVKPLHCSLFHCVRFLHFMYIVTLNSIRGVSK